MNARLPYDVSWFERPAHVKYRHILIHAFLFSQLKERMIDRTVRLEYRASRKAKEKEHARKPFPRQPYAADREAATQAKRCRTDAAAAAPAGAGDPRIDQLAAMGFGRARAAAALAAGGSLPVELLFSSP